MEPQAEKKGLIYYLSLVGFFGIFTTTMAKNPVLPLFIEGMGGSPEVIGIVSAVSPFAGMLFSFPIGILSDRMGRRKILIISGAVFLSAPLLYLLVSDPLLLIPVRFFHGLATAILGPVASAAIAAAYPDTKGEKLGTYSSATLVGRTLAPIAGGAILSYFLYRGGADQSGLWPYKAVYVAAFFASIPAFIFCFFIGAGPAYSKDGGARGRPDRGGSAFREGLAYFFRERRLVSTALVEMATYFSFGAFETYLPIYLSQHGYGAGVIGLIFSVQILAIALTKPLFGRVADRSDKRVQIAAGLLAIGTAMLLLTFFTGEAAVIAVSLLFALGMSFSTVATSAYTAEIAHPARLGASMGALSSVMDIGHTTGPLVTGFVITWFSLRAGFVTSFALCVALALVFAVATAGRKRATSPQGGTSPK